MHSITSRYPRPLPWAEIKALAECLAVFLAVVAVALLTMSQ